MRPAFALLLCLLPLPGGAAPAPGEDRVERAWRLNLAAYDLFGKGDREGAVALWRREVLPVYRDVMPPCEPSVTNLLNNLGGALRELGRPGEALPVLHEAVFLRGKELGAPDLADSLLNLGLVLGDLGRLEAAVAPLTEAAERYRGALPRHRARLDDANTNLGKVLYDLARFEEALPPLEEALAARRAARPPDPTGVVRGLNNVGVALRSLGRGDEASKLFREALALQRAAFPPGDPGAFSTLVNVGIDALLAGRHGEARRHLEAALALRRADRLARPAEVGEALYHLTTVLHTQGQWEAARQAAEEGLAVRRAALRPGHPDVAASLGQLGTVLLELGDHEGALRRLGEALAVARGSLPPGHPQVRRAWNNLGSALAQVGRAEEAVQHFEEAVRPHRGPGLVTPEQMCLFHMNLGLIEWDRGRIDAARRQLEGAVAISREARQLERRGGAEARINLAKLLQQLGQHRQALALFAEAADLLRKVLPADHPAQVHALAAVGVGFANLGELASARRRLEESVRLGRACLPHLHSDLVDPLHFLSFVSRREGNLPAAWRHADEAAGLVAADRWQLLLSSPGHAHPAFVARIRPVRDNLLLLLELSGGAVPGQCEGTLGHILGLKGLSAAALQARHEAALLGADAAGRARLEELRAVRRRLAGLMLSAPGSSDPDETRRRATGLRLEQDHLEADLAERVRGYAELRGADGADAGLVAARLAPGEVLVECCFYSSSGLEAQERTGRYGAFVLWRGARGGEVRFVPLGRAAPLERAARAWRAAVQRGSREVAAEAELRRLLWEPLARELPAGAARLVVAPEGELALVPLEALRLEGGEYLIERYAVRYVTSGRDLLTPAPAAGAGRGAVLLGDPDYGAPPGEKASPAIGPAFARLGGFRREMEAAERSVRARAGWDLTVRAGREASEEALAGVRRPRLLYLITHGFFLESAAPQSRAGGLRELQLVGASGAARVTWSAAGGDPRVRSGLALAGANQWQERSAKGLSDGLLTALEVENLDLWGTELVVLSACDTGRGEVQVGEGVLGLRRAFQLAGARAVIASLWKVPDSETERLMSDALSRWLKGERPHEALREAQLAMIRHLRESGARNGKQGEAPPLYWAGFVCHGESSPPAP